MQGNLNEIDIHSIFQLIELGQRTGLLFVEADSNHHSYFRPGWDGVDYYACSHSDRPSWYVFFLNGQIIYAASGDNSLSRLNDYLHQYQVQVQLEQHQLDCLKTFNTLEYASLWKLLEENVINTTQVRSIIRSLVYETLFDLLNLQQGSFIFEVGSALVPQLTTLEIAPALSHAIKQVKNWKLLYPYIQSPEQIPVVTNIANLRSWLPEVTVNKLQHWADGKTSLRRLARYLHRDIVTVAKAIHPYVQQGWVQLVDASKLLTDKPPSPQQSRKQCVLCIDDAIAICSAVQQTLQAQGYEAIALSNPLEALGLIFQLKPDLIFCDLVMPELDGYEICAMLRHSRAFRLVPIVILTAKEEFLDRVRATIVGATDYLTKPFGNNELVILVEKYLNYPRL